VEMARWMSAVKSNAKEVFMVQACRQKNFKKDVLEDEKGIGGKYTAPLV
jgi:hypothetical protein